MGHRLQATSQTISKLLLCSYNLKQISWNLTLAALREELDRWKASGIMTDPQEKEDFDLIIFWEVRRELCMPSIFFRLKNLEQEKRVSDPLSHRS